MKLSEEGTVWSTLNTLYMRVSYSSKHQEMLSEQDFSHFPEETKRMKSHETKQNKKGSESPHELNL